MTKLYFLFFFCVVASAEHPLTRHSSVGAHDASGLSQSAHSNEARSAYKTASGLSNQGSSGYNAKVGHGSHGYSGLSSSAQDSRSSSPSGPGSPSGYSSGSSGTSTYTGSVRASDHSSASAEHPLTRHSSVGAHDASGLSQSAHSNEASSAYKTASGLSNQGSSGYNAKVGHGHGSQGYSGSSSSAQDSRSSSSSGPGSPSGYSSGSSGTSTYTGSVRASDDTSDYSGSASKTGSAGAGEYSQTRTSTYTGTSNQQEVFSASNERDHNGLSFHDVQNLAAEGNRRRLPNRYHGSPNRGRPVAPKRYGSVAPKYLSHRPYSRSGEAGESNQVSSYGSSGSNAGSAYSAEQQQRDHSVHSSSNSPGYSSHDYHENLESHQGYSGSSNQAGQSSANSGSARHDASAQHYRGGNSDFASEQSSNQYAAQDPENSRRFYLQNPRNPFEFPRYNNLDQFNDFNNENYYKAALGQYSK